VLSSGPTARLRVQSYCGTRGIWLKLTNGTSATPGLFDPRFPFTMLHVAAAVPLLYGHGRPTVVSSGEGWGVCIFWLGQQEGES
jgi:hypothetical protein